MKKRPAPPHQPSSSTTGKGRRKALKALAAGSGAAVLSKWSKPVIETAVLPAHAQATGPFTGSFAGSLASLQTGNWLDLLVPKAVAGVTVCGSDVGAPVCINVVADSVTARVLSGGGLLSGVGPLVGGSFNISLGGASSITGTLNGAQTQFSGQVTLECANPLQADAEGAFTGERIQVASLMLAGAATQASLYSYTAVLNALCPIDLAN